MKLRMKLRILFKLLPIIGDLIQELKKPEMKDPDYAIKTITDLIRTIVTALASAGIIKNFPELFI
jgi:hypothetical protein